MPKRSKEDTEVTIQTIMDAVVDQLLRLGYDKMSYTTLSQQTGYPELGSATISRRKPISPLR
ncbi:transcriptional regulator, TetR family [Vibrio cholerae]|nr:transcriptional regulator, TetR family [Vibrio cholerae]